MNCPKKKVPVYQSVIALNKVFLYLLEAPYWGIIITRNIIFFHWEIKKVFMWIHLLSTSLSVLENSGKFFYYFIQIVCGGNVTHCSRKTRKRVIGKQCRPRSDAAECGFWSGLGGGQVVRRCCVSYITGASNWYWLTFGQGLLFL